MKKRLLLFVLLLVAANVRLMATIIYVDSSNVSGPQDGSSWASAFYSFQDGIDFASAGDTVWVAKGIYFTPPFTSFTMKEGVKILGGFLNTHTSISQRSVQNNVTTLRGNNTTGIIRNNNNGLTSAAVLDGFTIRLGFSNTGGGGGIYNNNASPTISNCTFVDNYISGPDVIGGAAIYNNLSAPLIYSCTFNNNFCLQNPNQSNNISGGAIFNSNSSVTITNCVFLGNKTIYNFSLIISGGYGGAICNKSSTFNASNCTFTSDSAGRGGAIYNLQTTYTIDACTFTTNRGSSSIGTGGAIYNEQSTGTIKNTTLTGNSANTGGSSHGGRGGAIHNFLSSTTIDSCFFDANIAAGYNGSSDYCGGGAIFNDSVVLFRVKHTSFTQNATLGSNMGGGAIYNSRSPVVHIDSCSFIQNLAWPAGEGGAIGNFKSASSITNCLFSRNKGRNGGAIYNIYSNPTIANDSFSTNTADNGGAIYHLGSPNTSQAITSCTFINDSALDVTGQPSGAGGGIYNSGGTLNTLNCFFLANYNNAIYNRFAVLNVSGCIFSANTGNGGAISSGVSKNDITNSQFLNNKGYGNGGAIYMINGSNAENLSNISNCNFTGNYADPAFGDGGALYINDSVIVKNCFFSFNKAATGGAISLAGRSNKIVNCVLSKNRATYYGGGIYALGASPRVINSTLSGNSIDSLGANLTYPPGGGAVYNYSYNSANDSCLNMVNSIVWGNTTGIMGTPGAFPTYTYGLIQGLGAFPARRLLAGTTNPLFADTASGNYQLQSTSPCINKGSNTAIPAGITTDFAGNNRIMGDTVDLGAYEFNNIPLSTESLTFSARKQSDDEILLQWRNINEQQIHHYELQRSNDSKRFTSLTYVKAIGHGDNSYQFTDIHPLPSNYYRLLMIDEDGRLSYSKVLEISLKQSQQSFSIFPNPAKETITIHFSDDRFLSSTATITDTYGRLIQSLTIKQRDQRFSLSKLRAGVYLIKMANGEVYKIIKE